MGFSFSEIINSSDISSSVRNLYKYIYNHDSELFMIMNKTENDLKTMFPDVTRTSSTITIPCQHNSDDIVNMVTDSLNKAIDDVLNDSIEPSIKNNLFKIYANEYEVQIIRRAIR